MKLVSVENIPKAQDTPVDNLMKIYKTCLQMEKICIDGNGIGLAALQIGVPWRLFIARHLGNFQYYINCEYSSLVDINQKHLQSIEGCLSFPDRKFLVERYPKINVVGKMLIVDNDLKLVDFNIDITDTKDIFLIIAQHEIDHFYGREKMIDLIGREIEIFELGT